MRHVKNRDQQRERAAEYGAATGLGEREDVAYARALRRPPDAGLALARPPDGAAASRDGLFLSVGGGEGCMDGSAGWGL